MEILPITPNNPAKVSAQNNSAAKTIKDKILQKPVQTAVVGGSSLLILAAAIAKRNTIAKFLKKLFKNNLTKETTEISAAQQKTKIKLPEPKFTAGENNPEQLAKEKAEYIKAIWDEFLDVNPPFKPMNKEKNLLGLRALQNYGTREDMLKLNDEYQLSKDSDIMKEYAKLVGKVGITKDALTLRAKTNKNKINLYSEPTIEEITKTLKKLMVDKAEKGYFVNASYNEYKDYERLSNHPNKIISENAKAIMKRLSDENPWMLE